MDIVLNVTGRNKMTKKEKNFINWIEKQNRFELIRISRNQQRHDQGRNTKK
jgi:hypothetical protein